VHVASLYLFVRSDIWLVPEFNKTFIESIQPKQVPPEPEVERPAIILAEAGQLVEVADGVVPEQPIVL
jgi:hypothetical protein